MKMINPWNKKVSLLQLLYGLAGLPLTVLNSAFSRSEGRTQLLVLCYHKIVREQSPETICDNHYFMSLPIDVFVRQIRWVKRHFQVVSLDDVLSGKRLAGRVALITFDDGHKSVYETAFPVLRSMEIPATVFLIGSLIREGMVPWNYQLHWLLDRSCESPLSAPLDPDPEMPGVQVDVLSALNRYKARMKKQDIHEIHDTLSGLKARLGLDLPPDHVQGHFMVDKEIHALCSHGWTMGNHTDNHLKLSALTPERTQREITDAHHALSRFSGYRPVLALPFGDPGSFSSETLAVARRSTMGHVFTASGYVNSLDGGPFLLHRIICETFSMLYFTFLARGGKSVVRKIMASRGSNEKEFSCARGGV